MCDLRTRKKCGLTAVSDYFVFSLPSPSRVGRLEATATAHDDAHAMFVVVVALDAILALAEITVVGSIGLSFAAICPCVRRCRRAGTYPSPFCRSSPPPLSLSVCVSLCLFVRVCVLSLPPSPSLVCMHVFTPRRVSRGAGCVLGLPDRDRLPHGRQHQRRQEHGRGI